MELTYEENLQENPFFVKIMENHVSLVNEIAASTWVIVCPKKQQITEESLRNHEFLLAHILLPSEDLPKTHFTNLLGDSVRIDGKFLRTRSDKTSNIEILSEEIFYTNDLRKFKILCISLPLCSKFIRECEGFKMVRSVAEATNLIKKYSVKLNGMKKIDQAISNFTLRIQKASDYNNLKTNIRLLYDYCVNLICYKRNKNLDSHLITNLKIAIEYYLMDVLYEKVFDAISIQHVEENQKFNKILRSLSDIDIEDLNLPNHIVPNLRENLNQMKMEFFKMGSCKCSLEKLYCVKNVCDSITTNDEKLIIVDELLPVVVYAVIKTNFFHWIPTLVFIKEFTMSNVLGPESQSNVFSYILTTLEAVIYFIQTNENLNLKSKQLISLTKVDELKSHDDYANLLFQYIKENNEIQFNNEIQRMNASFLPRTSNQISLCHPLCTCVKCKSNSVESERSINLRSKNNITMLHVASAFNAPKIAAVLLNNNADVDLTDENGWTPLHFAAHRGHQKVLFLLLHSKSDINALTRDHQTPLLLASMNGHDGCVKALLYFADYTSIMIDLNVQDNIGNTAIHYASQAGYDAIIESLLEYRAKVTIKNNIGKIPSDYAYSSLVRNKLQSAAKYQVEENPVHEDYVFLTSEDLADNLV